MNDLQSFNVKFPDGSVEQIISNISNLKKEIFKKLSKNKRLLEKVKTIPTDNMIIYDDRMNVLYDDRMNASNDDRKNAYNVIIHDDRRKVYSQSTLLYEYSQNFTVIDASNAIQELMEMKSQIPQHEKNLQELERMTNIVQMLNIECAKKDSEINQLKDNQIQQNSTTQQLRQTFGDYEDKYRALFLEYDQQKKNYLKLDEDYKILNSENENNQLKIKKKDKQILEQNKLYLKICQEKNRLDEDLQLKTQEYNLSSMYQEQKYERLETIIQQLKLAGINIEKSQDSKYQKNFIKCESKQVEILKKAQQEANNNWQTQINQMQNELTQIKQEKQKLEHNYIELEGEYRKLQTERNQINEQLISKQNQVLELNKIKNEQSNKIYQQEELSIQLNQSQEKMLSIQNDNCTLQKIVENQKLALEKAKQFMRYQDIQQSCIQKLYCEDIGTIFQKEGLQIDEKEMKIFKIEKGDKFQNLFEKQDYYRLEHTLQLVLLDQVKIRRSINPIVQDSQHQGFFMEIIENQLPKDCKCKYLLNIQSLKEVNAFFYQDKEATAQALNHIIVDEFLKVFIQDINNIQYSNFKVATPYILQENMNQFYYCIGIDLVINLRNNTDFPSAFRNYVFQKSNQNLNIGNMILISNTIHDVQIQTQYGFLTEQDRGQQYI